MIQKSILLEGRCKHFTSVRQTSRLGSMKTEAIPRLRIPEALVYEFLVSFARFEYALKGGGYARRGDNHAVKPDWDRFTRVLETEHADLVESIVGAGQYLLDEPARVQVVRGNTLGWADAPRIGGESDFSYLIRSLRRVRNNLFHGGKFAGGSSDDPQRNKRLPRAPPQALHALPD